MMDANDLEKNRIAWNEKTPIHLESAFYDVGAFRAGQSSLNEMELRLVGDVKSKSLLHLQCHFGLDTLSFARLGANVTGLDFSPVSIDAATKLAKEIDVEAEFVCADVHQAPTAVGQRTFDCVFTSYGALGWLPNMDAWAKAAAACVAPGGRLVVVEFHPFVWVWDDDFKKIVYPWDSAGNVIAEESEGTYAETAAPIAPATSSWNHGVGTVINALIQQGLKIERLEETTRSPYNVFVSAKKTDEGDYYISNLGSEVPLIYGLVATRS